MNHVKSLLALSMLLSSAFVFASPAPQLKPYTYRFKAPAGAQSCADHASAVAKAFAQGAQKRAVNVTGTCQSQETFASENQQYTLDVIILSYSAESEISPFRTVFGANASLDRADPTAGIFKTYAECLTQLDAQSSLFATETGVVPFASYCTASENQFFPGYSLTLESLGDLKRRLYTFAEDSISVTEDVSDVINASLGAIASAGGHLAWHDGKRVFYYSEGRLPVASENLGMFEDSSQCTSQQPQAQAIFTQAGLVGVSAFCRIESTYGKTFATLFVVGAGSDEVSDMEADRYGSFAECVGDLDRVLQNAASRLGHPAYGGLCSPDLGASNTGFRAHVYYGYY